MAVSQDRASRRGRGVTLGAVIALGIYAFPAMADPVNLVANGTFQTPAAWNPAVSGNEAASSGMAGWGFSACVTACDSTGALASFVAPDTAGIYDSELNLKITFNQGGPGNSPLGGNVYIADADYQVGQLQQTVTGLTVGQTYALSFYQAAMGYSGYSDPFTTAWQVGFGGDTVSAPAMNTPAGGVTGWSMQTLDFTATSVDEVLSFMASGTNSYPPFLLLDGVSLTQVPEPAALALLSVGLCGVFVARRRQLARA